MHETSLQNLLAHNARKSNLPDYKFSLDKSLNCCGNGQALKPCFFNISAAVTARRPDRQ
jgi:hypothetical protein